MWRYSFSPTPPLPHPATGNKDICAAESVQATASSKNQMHCCHKWWELSLNALTRNSTLKYFCWLRKAGFGKSAHVSHAFDSARNTVTELCSCPVKVFFLRELSQTSLIIKIQCLLFLLRSLKVFYLVYYLFIYILNIYICLYLYACTHTMYFSLLCYLFTVCIFCQFLLTFRHVLPTR